MLRPTALALLLVGASACGRYGFGPVGDSGKDGAVDAPIDTPVGLLCSTDLECGRCARCAGTCMVERVAELGGGPYPDPGDLRSLGHGRSSRMRAERRAVSIGSSSCRPF